MVKWYNESLPRISREFDSPWPHKIPKTDANASVFRLYFVAARENRKKLLAKPGAKPCARTEAPGQRVLT